MRFHEKNLSKENICPVIYCSGNMDSSDIHNSILKKTKSIEEELPDFASLQISDENLPRKKVQFYGLDLKRNKDVRSRECVTMIEGSEFSLQEYVMGGDDFADRFLAKTHAKTSLFRNNQYSNQAKKSHCWVERHNSSEHGRSEAVCSKDCLRPRGKYSSFLICELCYTCFYCSSKRHIFCKKVSKRPIKERSLGKRLLYGRYQEALQEAFGFHPPIKVCELNLEDNNDILPKTDEFEYCSSSFDRAIALIDTDLRLHEHVLDEKYIDNKERAEAAQPFLGKNILNAAMMFGNLDDLKALLRNGVNPRILDKEGQRAEKFVGGDDVSAKKKLLGFYQKQEKIVDWSIGVKHWDDFAIRMLSINDLYPVKTINQSDCKLFFQIRAPGAERSEPRSKYIHFAAHSDWSFMEYTHFRCNSLIKSLANNEELTISVYMNDNMGTDTILAKLHLSRAQLYSCLHETQKGIKDTFSFPLSSNKKIRPGASLTLKFQSVQRTTKQEEKMKYMHRKDLRSLLQYSIIPLLQKQQSISKTDFGLKRLGGKSIFHAAICLDDEESVMKILSLEYPSKDADWTSILSFAKIESSHSLYESIKSYFLLEIVKKGGTMEERQLNSQ